MIIIEISNIDSSDDRKIIWDIYISIYMINLYYFLPLLIIYFITKNLFSNNKVIKTLIIILSIIYFLSSNFLYHLFKMKKNINYSFFYINFSSITEYLGFISIFISSFLNSYGSVQIILNYIYFPLFRNEYYKLRFQDRSKRLESIKSEINSNYCNNIKLSTDNENVIYNGRYNSTYNINTSFDNNIDKSLFLKKGSKLYNELVQMEDEIELELEIIIEKYKYNPSLFCLIYSNQLQNSKYFNIQYRIFRYINIFLSIYSLYKIFNTIKNLLFSDYSNINLTLREDVLNIVDWILDFIGFIFKSHFSEICHTIIEQYFSLFIVSIVILTNLKSFLSMLQFIYKKSIKIFSKVKVSSPVKYILLSYLCCLFYLTSTLFLISNLPLRYRTEIVKYYGEIDFSLLKLYFDRNYILFCVIFSIIEVVIGYME